jgi:tetratricopeptide (TPR) repeat protein
MAIRIVEVQTSDPNHAHGLMRGVMFSYSTLALLATVISLCLLAAAGYAYARFREKSRMIDSLDGTVKFQRDKFNLLAAETKRLSKRLETAAAGTATSEREKYLAVHGEAGEWHLELLKQFAERDWLASLNLCEKILEQKHLDRYLHQDTLLKYVTCFFYLGKHDEALAAIDSGLENFPDYYPLLQRQADIFVIREEYSKALPIVERLARKSPSPGVLFTRGNVYYGLGDYKQAAANFRAVLSSGDPVQERAAANNLALIWAEKLKNFARAEIYVNVLLGLAPESPRTLATVGRVALVQGNLRRARKFLGESHQAAPRNLDNLLNLALLAELEGDRTQSETWLKQAKEQGEIWEKVYTRLRADIAFTSPLPEFNR